MMGNQRAPLMRGPVLVHGIFPPGNWRYMKIGLWHEDTHFAVGVWIWSIDIA